MEFEQIKLEHKIGQTAMVVSGKAINYPSKQNNFKQAKANIGRKTPKKGKHACKKRIWS